MLNSREVQEGPDRLSLLSHLSKRFFPVTGLIIHVTKFPSKISVLSHGDTSSKSVATGMKAGLKDRVNPVSQVRSSGRRR